MFHSVKIEGYRGFSQFSMAGLGQINLLIGKNNAGKTSVLEALYLLSTGGDPGALWRIMARKGEQLAPDPTAGRPQQELDVCHLFSGHHLKIGMKAKIATKNQIPEQSITYEIAGPQREKSPQLYAQIPLEPEGAGRASQFSILVTGNPKPMIDVIPLSSRDGLRPEIFNILNAITSNISRPDAPTPQYISTDAFSGQDLAAAFGAIALTPHEDRVIKALQFLEPGLERIATTPPMGGMFVGGFPTRTGFKAKLKQFNQPVSIGSLGDGAWRMLALAIILTRSKGSLLLIDEIDTGFHYTVMENVWKLVAQAALELGIQVFATTHSDDCVRSLAAICNPDFHLKGVSVQRIEADNENAIPFSEAEIIAAAKARVEIR